MYIIEKILCMPLNIFYYSAKTCVYIFVPYSLQPISNYSIESLYDHYKPINNIIIVIICCSGYYITKIIINKLLKDKEPELFEDFIIV
jgi:hypothetical protein